MFNFYTWRNLASTDALVEKVSVSLHQKKWLDLPPFCMNLHVYWEDGEIMFKPTTGRQVLWQTYGGISSGCALLAYIERIFRDRNTQCYRNFDL